MAQSYFSEQRLMVRGQCEQWETVAPKPAVSTPLLLIRQTHVRLCKHTTLTLSLPAGCSKYATLALTYTSTANLTVSGLITQASWSAKVTLPAFLCCVLFPFEANDKAGHCQENSQWGRKQMGDDDIDYTQAERTSYRLYPGAPANSFLSLQVRTRQMQTICCMLPV